MSQKRRPQPLIVYYAENPVSQLSPIWAAATGRGVWAVAYGMSQSDFLVEAAQRGPAKFIYEAKRVQSVLKQLEEFLRGKRRRFDLSVDWRGMTAFQIAVRKAVIAVPYSKTASYGEIAAAVGRPQASRAVGRVQATNPISFIIPCHRIIGADGSLHGYGGFGGLKTKAWLLDLEAKHAG